MALYQVTAGDRVLAADINQFYNILKGVTASGEAVTLIYNAAGVLILQPSSNPAAGTELIQIKNNAGTVQSALSSDGKLYLADGTVAVPGLSFESDKDTGIYRTGANAMSVAAGGVLVAPLAIATATVAGFVPTPPNNTTTFLRGDATFAAPAASGTTVVITKIEKTTAFTTTSTSYVQVTGLSQSVVVASPSNNVEFLFHGGVFYTTVGAGTVSVRIQNTTDAVTHGSAYHASAVNVGIPVSLGRITTQTTATSTVEVQAKASANTFNLDNDGGPMSLTAKEYR